MIRYHFDGSYSGYLSGVFDAFVRKDREIRWETEESLALFDEPYRVVTDPEKAERVVRGLEKRLGQAAALDFFRCFLSEDRSAWESAFRLMVRIFQGEVTLLKNFGDEDVLYFSQTLKKVSRERHRMKAFIRFSKGSDGLYFAVIEPDFNVLPLIIAFFRNRYADQAWLIYDTKRNYGILYDKNTCSEVQLEQGVQDSLSPVVPIALDAQYEGLWKAYFQAVNIPARKNMKLHLRHVPRRYWKFLPEKS
jgi:probable DNA metabolism protein